MMSVGVCMPLCTKKPERAVGALGRIYGNKCSFVPCLPLAETVRDHGMSVRPKLEKDDGQYAVLTRVVSTELTIVLSYSSA